MKLNPKNVAETIYENLIRAFGGSSQFEPITMFNALKGHVRNGLMNPTTANHNKVFVEEVWNNLLAFYFAIDIIELDDKTKKVYDKANEDGHEIIDANESLT